MADHTLITTPFSGASTAADVLDGVDLTGVRAVVTGASSGLGAEPPERSLLLAPR